MRFFFVCAVAAWAIVLASCASFYTPRQYGLLLATQFPSLALGTLFGVALGLRRRKEGR